MAHAKLVVLDLDQEAALLEVLQDLFAAGKTVHSRVDEAGLDRVIRAGYKLLGLQTNFTAGVKEVRAWTIPVGATAPQAAGVIHTDFEKGFIRAETIAYDDFIKYGGERVPRTRAS